MGPFLTLNGVQATRHHAMETHSHKPVKVQNVLHHSGDFSPIILICEVGVGPLGNFAMELKYT